MARIGDVALRGFELRIVKTWRAMIVGGWTNLKEGIGDEKRPILVAPVWPA
jgi:hypothetical protein